MTDAVVRHVRPASGPGTLLEITPASVGWRYLSFRVIELRAGESIRADTGSREAAIVPLGGSGWIEFGGDRHPVARRDVFTDLPHVAYLPPGTKYAIGAVGSLEVAIGEAPAEGRHPARLYLPGELPTFLRGGANVSRGVTCALDPTFPSERLIAYEVLTPSGNWSSWPAPPTATARCATARAPKARTKPVGWRWKLPKRAWRWASGPSGSWLKRSARQSHGIVRSTRARTREHCADQRSPLTRHCAEPIHHRRLDTGWFETGRAPARG